MFHVFQTLWLGTEFAKNNYRAKMEGCQRDDLAGSLALSTWGECRLPFSLE